MITLTLPYPPSVNTYWGKRIITSKAGAQFISVYVCTKGTVFASRVSHTVMLQLQGRVATLRGALVMTVDLYPPDLRHRDIDNGLKSLLDSMQKARVYVNDEQIKKLTIHVHEKVSGGKAVVTIEEISPPLFDKGQNDESAGSVKRRGRKNAVRKNTGVPQTGLFAVDA